MAVILCQERAKEFLRETILITKWEVLFSKTPGEFGNSIFIVQNKCISYMSNLLK